MGAVVDDRGEGNRIDIDPTETFADFAITLYGNRNRICVGQGAELGTTHIEIHGDDNVVEIGDRCGGLFQAIFVTDGAALRLGEETTLVEAFFNFHEPCEIRLGNDCMVSGEVFFSVSDMHPIIDLESKQRINYGRSIEIGDHVWIGAQAQILKGAKIGSGSIIGTRAVVTGAIPENCIAVGVPAKVIRHNVSWDRKLESFRGSLLTTIPKSRQHRRS
jgi:acetyltransferase-like isoleucine patch superfamily enzyme